VAPARLAAFRILLQVETEGRHADDLLYGTALAKLSPRDRALATNLVMGTLRWQLVLDAAFAPLLRTGTVLVPEVSIALRMGLLQLWFLDRIPAHAALGESVELVKVHGIGGMAGLVNAILRKLSQQRPPEFSKAAMLAHPAWMVDRWRVIYGASTAQTICEADQQIPRSAVRLVPEAPPPDELGSANFLSAAGILDPEQQNVQNQFRVQDEGSQLVAEIAAAAAPAAARALDACAAPGGKTAILAEMLPGCEIVAADVSGSRLKTMRRLLPQRSDGRVKLVQADARALPAEAPFQQPFDLVLCDVPCSGTGTLGRNPEIRLNLSASQLAKHAQNQLQILQSCWKQLIVGGILVYSTCSLEPEENQQVVDRLMAQQKDAERVPVLDLLRQMLLAGRLSESGFAMLSGSAIQGDALRTVQGVHPCDGFFVAVFKKG
jgi:16S rRNA (cytosine967-C5)-methyltransferase